MSTKNNQIGGDHYRQKKFQPIEYIMENELGYCEGNVVKYVSRWRDKGGVQDLMKARQYLDFLIEKNTEINCESLPYEGPISRLLSRLKSKFSIKRKN